MNFLWDKKREGIKEKEARKSNLMNFLHAIKIVFTKSDKRRRKPSRKGSKNVVSLYQRSLFRVKAMWSDYGSRTRFTPGENLCGALHSRIIMRVTLEGIM